MRYEGFHDVFISNLKITLWLLVLYFMFEILHLSYEHTDLLHTFCTSTHCYICAEHGAQAQQTCF